MDTKEQKDVNQPVDFSYYFGDAMGGFAPVPADQMGWPLGISLVVLAGVCLYLWLVGA